MRVSLLLIACLLLAAPAAHADLPPGFVGLYGDDSFFGDASYRAGQMDAQARLGVQTVRQPLEWWRVERRPGHFDFSDYDTYMAGAARAGLRVLPVLMGPPQFRSSRPPDSSSRAMFPPKSNSAFAAFVGAAVRRYGDYGSFWSAHPELPYVPIHSWQVWNEPNIPNFWRSGPDPKEYVALLRAGSEAIRTSDPQAEVVAAGLPNSKLGVPFLDFLQGMYDAGAKGLFDTLAIHPYSPSAGGLLQLAERARVLMDSNGDRSALWLTEFGWSTGGAASAFRVSRQGQANRIALALSGLAAERIALRLRGFVLFKWKDSRPPAGADPWPLHAGLVGADGLPKQSFWTFARLVRSLSRRTPAAPGSAGPAQISRNDVRLSPLGNAGVVLGCASQATDACQGTLRLRTAKPVRCGGMSRRAGSQLGAVRFRIAIAPALAPVRLYGGALALARCMGRLRVRASVGRRDTSRTATAAASVEFVIRAD